MKQKIDREVMFKLLFVTNNNYFLNKYHYSCIKNTRSKVN